MLKILLTNLFFQILISQSAISADFDFKTYQKITRKVSKRYCKNNTEHIFNALFKKYRGDGFYIPTLAKNRPAKKIIKRNFHLFARKIKWIKKNKKMIKKKDNFDKDLFQLRKFSKRLISLLNIKYEKKNDFFYEWIIFKNDFNYFILNKLPYLLPFNYPVDFKKLRQRYEHMKILHGKSDVRTKELYFIRKFFEDGSQLKNHSKNDRFARANLSSLLRKLRNDRELSSETRVDLEYFLDGAKRQLLFGKEMMLERFFEWEKRVIKQQKFYTRILESFDVIKKIVAQKKHTEKLKSFVLQKEADVFTFWSKYKLEWQKLFVLETILTHEVGALKNLYDDKLEIGKVVLNRTTNSKYNKISPTDGIYSYLPKGYAKNIFLNTLFKEGEFSFTYFFIPSSLRLFCPDQSSRGQLFRKKNFEIAKVILQSPVKSIAVRYFSRVSIFGRYKMDDVWNKHRRLPIKAGGLLKSRLQKKYQNFLSSKKLLFLEVIKSENQREYIVYRVKGEKKIVLYDQRRKAFYTYRNPDLFSFFYFI